MKQIERYLCAQCSQDMIAAGLRCEEIPTKDKDRKPCDWCGRSCYGGHYRIFYGRRREDET